MYFLRRLKKLGASLNTLKEAYCLFVRPTLEMCAPLWTGALTRTKFLSDALERVQRSFCKMLFPYKSYDWSTQFLKLEKLSERRIFLAKRTAEKMIENPKYSHMFPQIEQNVSTRSCRKYREPKWKSLRYGFSALPFMIRLVNREQAR